MRRAATRHGGRCEPIHGVRWRRFAVVGDDRRSVVIRPEIQPAAAELRRVHRQHLLAQGCPSRRVGFDIRRHCAASFHQRRRRIHRVSRNLFGDRPTLRLMRREDVGIGPALQHASQHPGQVRGIGDTGVHAIAGERHPEVRGVATDKNAPVAEPIGQHAAADPVFLCQNLEFYAIAKNRADASIGVDGGEIGLVGA